MMLPTTFARRRATALVASLASGLMLMACGGGGGSTAEQVAPQVAAPTATIAAAMYFTDDFSNEYDAVWVSISRVTAVNGSGVEVELLAYAPSRRLNLPALRDAGTWAANAKIPTDTVAVRVYVDPQAQLQQLNGSVQDVTLSTAAGYLSFQLDSWNRSSGALALDFDLPRFTLQGTTLVAATRVATHDDLSTWNHRDAEIKGSVTAVSANSLTIDAGVFGTRLFVLDANTSYVSLQSNSWQPALGDTVEVYGSVSGQGVELQFTARVIKQRSSASSNNASAVLSSEIKGLVGSVNGTVATLTVNASRYGGPTGTLPIDLATAVFKRGSLAAVVAGVRLEVYLTRVGDRWVAQAVEIEGAAKAGSSSNTGSSGNSNGNDTGTGTGTGYAELKGRVVTVSGSRVTLTPLYTERFSGVLPAGNVTVDLANAYFEKSALSCLVAGTPIELKGSLDAAGSFLVVKVEAEGACASAIPVSGVTASAGSSAAALNGRLIEAKGTISAVRAGEFDLTVYRIEGLSSGLSSVVVRYNNATVFKDISAATLVAGRFMEIKGILTDGVITAVKVERD